MPSYPIPFFRKLINDVFLKYDSTQSKKRVETGKNGKAILKNNEPMGIFFEDLADDISQKVKGKQIIPETFQKKYNLLLKEESENEEGMVIANAGFIDKLCQYAVNLDGESAERLWFGTNKEKIITLLDQLDERKIEGLLRLSEKLAGVGINVNIKPDKGAATFTVALNYILNEQLEMLDKMNQNEQMFITGKPMYELYKYIAEEFEMKRCFAMSYKDLDYWSTPAAKHWLSANERMVQRGIHVERTFIISSRAEIDHSEKNKLVLRKHIRDLGIKIRLLLDLEGFSRQFSNPGKELEFSVYDHKLALYWNHEWGIYLDVWFNEREVKRCLKNYNNAIEYCQFVPLKTIGDKRLIESEKELDAWLNG